MRIYEVLNAYSVYGTWKAGELLLPPSLAIQVLDVMHEARVSIIGLSTWKQVPEGIVEISNGFSFDRELTSSNPVEATYIIARECILSYLPPGTDFVSLVLPE